MRRMSKVTTAAVAMGLVVAACGGNSSGSTTTPTTAATTTTTAATTTTPPAPQFTDGDLFRAVVMDGDPWAVPVVDVIPFELTLDDIWPADVFPDERQVYVDAGFEAASFGFFGEDDGVLITGAHLFATADGADMALTVLEGSFSDTDLIAEITGLAPGALTDFELVDVGLGDRAVGVILTGAEVQVVGIVWITGNLLQFVRAGMDLGDEDRASAAFDVAAAMAGRME